MKETQTFLKIRKRLLFIPVFGMLICCHSSRDLSNEAVIVKEGKMILGQDSLSVQINLWRNMMPGFGEGVDRSLRILIDVKSSKLIPGQFALDSACATQTRTAEKWCSQPKNKKDFGEFHNSFEASGGPTWRNDEDVSVMIYGSFKGNSFVYPAQNIKVMFTH